MSPPKLPLALRPHTSHHGFGAERGGGSAQVMLERAAQRNQAVLEAHLQEFAEEGGLCFASRLREVRIASPTSPRASFDLPAVTPKATCEVVPVIPDDPSDLLGEDHAQQIYQSHLRSCTATEKW